MLLHLSSIHHGISMKITTSQKKVSDDYFALGLNDGHNLGMLFSAHFLQKMNLHVDSGLHCDNWPNPVKAVSGCSQCWARLDSIVRARLALQTSETFYLWVWDWHKPLF